MNTCPGFIVYKVYLLPVSHPVLRCFLQPWRPLFLVGSQHHVGRSDFRSRPQTVGCSQLCSGAMSCLLCITDFLFVCSHLLTLFLSSPAAAGGLAAALP